MENLTKERNISVTHMTNNEMGQLLRMLHDMQMNIVDTDNALKANERYLRFITDSLPAQISYIDSKEQHQFCNIKYARSYYQPKNEITDQTLKKVIGDSNYTFIKTPVLYYLVVESSSCLEFKAKVEKKRRTSQLIRVFFSAFNAEIEANATYATSK